MSPRGPAIVAPEVRAESVLLVRGDGTREARGWTPAPIAMTTINIAKVRPTWSGILGLNRRVLWSAMACVAATTPTQKAFQSD
jgi:hypothetical protein